MPIEIRELVIKATVNNNLGNTSKASLDKRDLARLKKEVVKECVETVMEKIEKKNNR